MEANCLWQEGKLREDGFGGGHPLYKMLLIVFRSRNTQNLKRLKFRDIVFSYIYIVFSYLELSFSKVFGIQTKKKIDLSDKINQICQKLRKHVFSVKVVDRNYHYFHRKGT
eukprot:TRINITY_DN3556_c0_g2_i2.p7 TRINITY_DN3556_c0_g2~~TRINITY_DN3556_c0_g2_i2.p7  ORF type:complete len:111 (+),score=1.82 TRINITY_DN3556_c0_g2_i2:215-547(+)